MDERTPAGLSVRRNCTCMPWRLKHAKCIAAKVCELYPMLEDTGIIDVILPKKEHATIAKL